jgi:CRP-like cAMP-binding protein
MAIDSRIAFLSQFSLFDVLTPSEMKKLGEMIEERRAAKHHFIYLPEEICNSLYFLVKGTVKVGIHSDEGREVIKAILHPSVMFGEWSILGEEKHLNFAKAMDKDVVYYVLKDEAFKQLMKSNFNFCLKVMEILGKKLKFAERRLESMVFQDARARIIAFIKENAINFGRQVGLEMLVKHSLTQQDIANFTGTSRQTVTSVLNDLRKSNQIHFKRKSILIRDMSSLS